MCILDKEHSWCDMQRQHRIWPTCSVLLAARTAVCCDQLHCKVLNMSSEYSSLPCCVSKVLLSTDLQEPLLQRRTFQELTCLVRKWCHEHCPCRHCAPVYSAEYVGCMKTGGIMKDTNLRWYEPQHAVLGGSTYFTHAWGSIYVLSGHIARDVASIEEGRLRFFNNEGTDNSHFISSYTVCAESMSWMVQIAALLAVPSTGRQLGRQGCV